MGKWNVGHCSERYLPAARGFDGFTGYFSPGLSYLDYTPDAERDFVDGAGGAAAASRGGSDAKLFSP